jgi:DNA-binding winged helix-turn-helix (wHTH) protein/TolB-like protein
MTPRVRFGRFEFDPSSLTLSRDGRPVRLQPQPARVLAVLLEHPGEVVSREALRQRIWSDGTFVDFERGLNFCVAQIRSALGDSAESPRFLETLPRRGYRLIAAVTVPDTEAPAAASADPEVRAHDVTAPEGAPSRTWRPFAAVSGAAVVLVVFAVLAAWRSGGEVRPVRVAVVPFDNETGRDTFDLVAAAVADATVARLAAPGRIPRLTVIGNSAALRRPRTFRDLKAIGQEVGVEYVVLAQMKADAREVRLIAHLIRISDEAHVWAETFDRPAFTLDVQAEIAEAIASAVSARLN